jgi:hypothetical protein
LLVTLLRASLKPVVILELWLTSLVVVKPVATEVFEAAVLLDFVATVDDDTLFPKYANVDA